MARYGTFRYGEALYGEEPTDNLLWALEIDWDGDGKFDGSNEAGYMTDLEVTRGRDLFIKQDGSGFAWVEVGRAIATVENVDGRYDPYNTASPLYPYIGPGKKIRLRVKNGSAGTFYPLMTGRIADIPPLSGVETAQIEMVDGTQALMDEKVTIAVQEDQQVDDLIHLVLDEVGWPEDDRAIDASIDTIPYWWADDVSAWEALCGLADGVLGTFFVAADGKATFISRAHSAEESVTLDADELRKEAALPRPWYNIRNSIDIKVRTRVAYADEELWRLREVIEVAPGGESFETFAEFSYNGQAVPASPVTTPVATTDFTVNAAADGGGADLTASCAVSIYVFGMRAKVTLTNNSASTGYITLLKIRGTALYAQDAGGQQREDAASIALYGRRSFLLDSDWLQDSNLAISFADYLATNLPLVRSFPEVEIDARPELQFALDLFTRAAMNIPTKGIANVFQAAKITHSWLADTGQAVRTAVRFEPVPPAVIQWTFPVKIGEESYFAF